MDAYLDTVESPVGAIAFATDGDGALLAVKFAAGHYPRTLEEELARQGCTLHHGTAAASGDEAGVGAKVGAGGSAGPTARARREIAEYFAGERTRFAVPVVLRGSRFQEDVWRELMRIPYGQTRTYGEIAGALGKPAASRAVGRANGTNHIPLVIPCHRVVGADGTLTGFGGGVHIKSHLLSFERGALFPG